MIHRWIYVSKSVIEPDDVDAQVEQILAISKPRNLTLGVTGGLMLSGQRFAQYLEGPSSSIHELQVSIRRDLRHVDVTTVEERPCPDRLFAQWSLIYVGGSMFFNRILQQVELGAHSQARPVVEDTLSLFSEVAAQAKRG